MEEDIRGQFVERTTEDGIRYAIYVPENVNPDTPIFTYVHGSGGAGADWVNAKNGVLEHGSNSIIIMPTMSWSADWGKNTMNIVNDVKQEYGITNTNVSSSGFSMGGFAGYVTVAENIKQNPDAEPQTVFFIDDYGSKTYYQTEKTLSDEETVQAFRDNQTIFFIYEPNGKNQKATTLYGQSGLNVVRVICNGQDHVGINRKFFANGVYDYMAGGTLPKDGYTYQRYNSETGKWEDIPYENIATQDDLYNYFQIDTFVSNMDRLYVLPDITIKSSDKTLEGYINDIRKAIRNTNFLTANFNEAGYLSTTKVPTSLPETITEYFSMTSSLLNSIARKTQTIAQIAGEIELLDKRMASRAEQVNNATPLFVATDFVPEISINDPAYEDPTIGELADQIIEPPEVDENEETPSTPQEQPKDETGTTPVVPPTLPDSNDDNDEESQPEKPSGGDNNNNNNQPDNPTEELPIEEQFPKYEELYSDDNKTVYNYNDEYKVVIHHEDGKITGVEHYYDFKTTEDATAAIKELETTYKDVENFDKVIQKDQYVKVMFKEDMYKDITLDKFKENYKELKEVVEE